MKTSAALTRLAVVGVIAAVGVPPAFAQQGALEEIIVTARKREESLQDTPISVSAYSGENLEVRGITKLSAITDFTPNLVFHNTPTFSGTTSNAVVYIRGVGQNDFTPTLEPGVGIYVDGVFLGRSVGAVLDLIDIERVEVLRGPQGTLFGRNTIGGAISITTKKPAEEFGGKVDLKVGTDSRLNVRGSVDIPVTDVFFTKFTAATFQQDGYVRRPFDGKDLGDDDTVAARAALRWLPSNNLEINLTGDYSRDDENGPPHVRTGFDPLGPPPPSPPSQVVFNNLVADIFSGGVGDPSACLTAANATNPLCYNDQWTTGGATNLGTAPEFSESEIWSASLTVDWDVADFHIKSITGYRKLDSTFAADNDGSPLQIGHVFDIYEQEQITQELQLLGTSFNDRLEWILGFYYFQEDGKNINPVDFANVELQSGGFFDSESWAVFMQGTYDVTDKLSLTAGFRYTEDTKDYLPDQIIEFLHPVLLATGFPFSVGDRALPFETVRIEFEEPLPMVNVAYRWTEDLMTYFTYSEGFKSGGFTQRIFPPELNVPTFGPEFVESYEVGFKWTGFGDRLRLNAAGYFTDYSDLQVTVADPTRLGPFTSNAGDAEIAGFEAELTFVPAAGWMINASGGLTDAEYTELSGSVTGLTLDSEFERISKWNASASVSKDIGLGEWGMLTPRVDWSYRSSYFTNYANINSPQFDLFQPGFHLVNLSARWQSVDQNLSITAGVDNVGDKEYRVSGDLLPTFGWVNQIFHRGREWYATFSYSF